MSFPKCESCKDSGVGWLGEIPSHWEVIPARRIFSERRDAALSGDEQLSATQRFGVIPQRLFIEMQEQKVVLALTGTDNFKRVKKDDFVISLRSFQGGVEWSGYSGCVSPAYTVLYSAVKIVPSYWAYTLKCAAYISALQTVTLGIRDGKNIGYSQFGGIEVPVPPISEQEAIAIFLDRETAKIDELIAEQEKLLALLAKKRQATILSAITKGLNENAKLADTCVEWLGKIPAHWGFGALKRGYAVIDCKHVTAEFVEDGFPVASIREVQSRYVDLSLAKRTTLEYYEQLTDGDRKPLSGDLLFSRNATVGAVSQVLESHPMFAMGQDVCIIRRLNECCDPDFMYFVINSTCVSEQLNLLMVGATFKRVNVEDVRCLMVPVPPIDEQGEIAAHLRHEICKFEALQSHFESMISLLNERRSTLISAAVTGKIDVRGLVVLKEAA